MSNFNDDDVVMDQLNNFSKMCGPGTVIKKTIGKFNEKDGLVFFDKKLVAIVECKKRSRLFTDWILEVKKLKHWLKDYPDLKYIYLNRTPLGDFYLVVDRLKIKKYILHNTYHILDGSRGIEYRLGSRTDRGLSSDYDREWLLVNDNLFKKVKS